MCVGVCVRDQTQTLDVIFFKNLYSTDIHVNITGNYSMFQFVCVTWTCWVETEAQKCKNHKLIYQIL